MKTLKVTNLTPDTVKINMNNFDLVGKQMEWLYEAAKKSAMTNQEAKEKAEEMEEEYEQEHDHDCGLDMQGEGACDHKSHLPYES